jgi:hypothetical protein
MGNVWGTADLFLVVGCSRNAISWQPRLGEIETRDKLLLRAGQGPRWHMTCDVLCVWWWMAFHGCSEPRPPWSKTAVASVTISHPFWFGGLGLRVETSAPTEHTCRHSVFQVLQGQIEESEKKRASLESQVGLTGALCHFWVDFGSTKHINSPSLSFSQVISKNLHGTS